ncbi:HNH endonuclease signature motif containing protein [Arthrobacter sp. OV608]|uniref:HNH endonuclease signature motif containing protein n=1 Tax=Arthrobacter sp. OV608 TaxID=1882768 RepID=UPI000B824968|nr:HNH endonuclease signature motif containing protein [Arthrobacter sp. OV608]
METNPAVVEAEEAVDASVAAFVAVLTGQDSAGAGRDASGSVSCGADGPDDPLQRLVDGALDVLAAVGRSEAKIAAVKALAVTVVAEGTKALNGPASSPYEASAQDRSLVAEVGCALAIGDRAAGALLADSHALTTSLPRALAALQAGTMSWAHARTMVEQTSCLDPAAAAALEAHFLDPDAPGAARGCPIGEMPAYRFKARARTWRERHHPESLEKRHAKSLADRRVEYWPDNDGMAWVAALLPADHASAICNRLTAIARGKQGPTEPRTLPEIKADTFTESLLNTGTTVGSVADSTGGDNSTGSETSPSTGDDPKTGPEISAGEDHGAGDDSIASRAGSGSNGADSTGGHTSAGNDETDSAGAELKPGNNLAGAPGGDEFAGDGGGAGTAPGPLSGIRAQVLVTVPVFSLMGSTDEPAMLDGHGPIPPSMARRLVADGAASFYRVLVDPRDGAPLEIGRTNYRVSKAMRQWLRLRDGKCPFPGCNNPSLDNEADHILAWDIGGSTGISNLGQPCPKHHKLRHTSGWKPTPASKTEPPGWTSPTGRHYKSEHQDWEPPHWPDVAVPESIRAFDALLDRWEPPDDPSDLCPPSRDPLEKWPPPDYSAAAESWRNEIPEETFADWFLSADTTKDPIPEDFFPEMAHDANAGVT